MYLTANAHVIWLSPAGEKVDITPKPSDFRHNGKNVFAPSYDAIIDVYRVPTKHYPLTKSEKVAEFILILEELERIRSSAPIGEVRSISNELMRKYKFLEEQKIAIAKSFLRKVTRNDYCPCESGIKHKNCCGNNNW